jgi:hypothetical protein
VRSDRLQRAHSNFSSFLIALHQASFVYRNKPGFPNGEFGGMRSQPMLVATYQRHDVPFADALVVVVPRSLLSFRYDRRCEGVRGHDLLCVRDHSHPRRMARIRADPAEDLLLGDWRRLLRGTENWRSGCRVDELPMSDQTTVTHTAHTDYTRAWHAQYDDHHTMTRGSAPACCVFSIGSRSLHPFCFLIRS